jgi:aldehyde dehydrogenase
MMPFIPVVRVKNVDEAIKEAVKAEHGYKHTAIMHSRNIDALTKMAQISDTTLFIKNGPCMTGLGLGGEGFLSFSIATPTGEGVTTPMTFTRSRRCVMVDNLNLY